MAKKEQEEEGVDLSTAAELWSEEELRELIREEARKLLQPNIQPPMPNTTQAQPWVQQPIYPQWTQTNSGTYNTLYDGHYTANTNLVSASS
jgi:hypothetical protein